MISVRDGFYTVLGVMAIEIGVLSGVCGFVVDICNDWAIFIFLMRMSKNGVF